MARTHLVRAVCADRKLGRVSGPYTVYTAVSVFGSCTAVYTILTGRKHGRTGYTAVYTAVYPVRVYGPERVHGCVRVMYGRVYAPGRKHGRVQSTRPCTQAVNTAIQSRVHGPYTTMYGRVHGS